MSIEEVQTRLEQVQAELANLTSAVAMLTDNQDLITTGLERHQAHHESVEQLLGQPITRAIVERMLLDVEARDSRAHAEAKRRDSKVIDVWGDGS